MEQKRTGLSYVFTLARGERGKLGVGMLLAVLCSALSLIPYLVVYQILLLIIQNEVTFGAMAMWACIGIAAAIGQAILMSFAGICSHVAAFNTMHKIKVKVLEHISRFNLGFFQERSPGQIKTTLFDDVDRVEQFLAHSTLELAQAIVVPLMMFIFMLRLHWVMALVMLIPMILGIAVPMMMVKNYPDMSAELAEDTEKLNASANEFITAMPVIKMYHLTAEKFEQYRNALHLYTTCWKKMCVSSCNPLSIALVVLDSAILFTLPFGGWLYSKGSLSVASYLLFILLTMCFFTSFLNLVTIVMQSMELGSGLDNIKKIMDMAFVASAMGKESALGVMASLFNTAGIWGAIEGTSAVDTAALSTNLLSTISQPEALAFLFAFFFNMPCLMALAATAQETHSMKWTVRIALYYILSALILATIAYHVGCVIF